ncbi:MAG: alpha/beta fold hydrolase [Pseudomonadota bacterium]
MRRFKISIATLCVVALVATYAMYVPDRSVDELVHWQNSESHFVRILGTDVHYRREGDPSKPTVVLLHGTSSSLHTWDAWTDAMRGQFEVVRMDLPGFGLTGPRADADYSIDAYVAFVHAFADALALDQFALAGNSLGGNIAWQYAAAHAERLSALVLLNASGLPTADKQPSLVFRLAQWPIVNKAIPLVAPKALYRRSVEEVFADDDKITAALIERYYELSLRTGNRRAFVQRVRQSTLAPVSQLDRIVAPTLVQWGAQDAWIPVSHAHQFGDAIANAQVIVYDGVGHTPMEEAPIRTVNDAITFIQSHSRDSALQTAIKDSQ